MSSPGASSSSCSARAHRARRRDLTRRRGEGVLDLFDLPPDVLVHILSLLPSIRDLVQVDRVCRLFAFREPSFGRHSLVEAALRIRHLAHTGMAVPGDLVREPWWPWSTTKSKLVHDERCRRGARLVPFVPDTVVNADIDARKWIVFYRNSNAAHRQPPPDMILGRMTRAFDNGQGIQDPRVSRQHLRIILQQGEAHEPNGVCRVQALGHNPSTIRRGKLAKLGLGFHAEPSSFKLRRGDMTTLYPGDVIQLVCEDVSRAHGRSLPFEGNACAYRVDFLPPEGDDDELPDGAVVLGREAEETDEEASQPDASQPADAASPQADGGAMPAHGSQQLAEPGLPALVPMEVAPTLL